MEMEQIAELSLEDSNDFHCFVKSVSSLLSDLWLDGQLISQLLKYFLRERSRGTGILLHNILL
jgi:hypothetical protein